MCQSASNQGYLPSAVAAEGFDWRAPAVLLKQPEANAILLPVCGDASWLCLVADADAVFNFLDDDVL